MFVCLLHKTTFNWFLFLPLGSLPRRDKAGLGRPEAAPVRHERSDPPASGRPEDGLGRPEAAALAARLAEGSGQTLTRENPFRDAILGLGRSFQQINKRRDIGYPVGPAVWEALISLVIEGAHNFFF
jgi:hypothetical protein